LTFSGWARYSRIKNVDNLYNYNDINFIEDLVMGDFYMKSRIFNLIVIIVVMAMQSTYATDTADDNKLKGSSCINSVQISTYLKWQDRPDNLKSREQEIFKILAHQVMSHWEYNGSEFYTIMDVAEEKLIHHLITSNHMQKEFYFLDIGAGKFQWGNSLAENINNFSDIPNDVKVHIIGVRGEQFQGPEYSNIGKCHIYKFGKFNIENLETSFKSKGLELNGKIDGIFTRWCFRHLVDPVGTLQQAYDLLKIKGLFFGDGFFYGLKGKHEQHETIIKAGIKNMAKLLLDMKVQFLIEPYILNHALHRFVFRKDTDEPLKLPLQYHGVVPIKDKADVYSNTATVFDHIGPEPELNTEIPADLNARCGDRDLFDFFQKNQLFYSMNKKYVPLEQRYN
jgi:SAM-dependent methyltransferase